MQRRSLSPSIARPVLPASARPIRMATATDVQLAAAEQQQYVERAATIPELKSPDGPRSRRGRGPAAFMPRARGHRGDAHCHSAGPASAARGHRALALAGVDGGVGGREFQRHGSVAHWPARHGHGHHCHCHPLRLRRHEHALHRERAQRLRLPQPGGARAPAARPRPPPRGPVLDPHPRPDPRRPHPILLSRLQQNLQPLQQHADAHVGARVAVPEGTRIATGDAADGDAAAAVLLLRSGVPEQHRPSAVEAAQGLPDAADALQAQARDQAIHVPQVQQGVRGARRLAHAREELRQALVLHLRLRLQAQALAQGPHPRLREWPRRPRHGLLRGRGGCRRRGRRRRSLRRLPVMHACSTAPMLDRMLACLHGMHACHASSMHPCIHASSSDFINGRSLSLLIYLDTWLFSSLLS